jgi:hypothetical protein
MKERLFFIWMILNRISIIFFVFLYLLSIATNLVDGGFKAFVVTPNIILNRILAGEFDALVIWLILFLVSWLIGWIATGRHAWSIGS